MNYLTIKVGAPGALHTVDIRHEFGGRYEVYVDGELHQSAGQYEIARDSLNTLVELFTSSALIDQMVENTNKLLEVSV